MGAARQPRAIRFETVCGLKLICSADGSREEALKANQHDCIPGKPSWHRTAGEGCGKAAPNELVQAWLKFTLKLGVWELHFFLSQFCSAVRQTKKMLCPWVCSHFQSQSHECLVSGRHRVALCNYPMNVPEKLQGKRQIPQPLQSSEAEFLHTQLPPAPVATDGKQRAALSPGNP